MKLNIGCGPNSQVDGFINIDNSKAVLLDKFPIIKKALYSINLISKDKYDADWKNILWVDVSRKMPFDTESIDKIYTSHFLEHIPKEKGIKVLMNCYRVLKLDGVLRLVLPDLLWHAEKYVIDTKEMMKKSDAFYNTVVHDDFLHTIYGAYLKKTRYGLEHCYMYDVPTIFFILKKVGFKTIQLCEYRKGFDKELAELDSRPKDSFHIECIK